MRDLFDISPSGGPCDGNNRRNREVLSNDRKSRISPAAGSVLPGDAIDELCLWSCPDEDKHSAIHGPIADSGRAQP